MSADLILAAAGSAAGVASVGFAFWQVMLARTQNRNLSQLKTVIRFSSQPPPFGRLPQVRGRDALLSSMTEHIKIDRRVQVISGMGGVGKTTIALKLCQILAEGGRRKRRRTWWIPASDRTSLTSGMLGIARELDAPASDLVLMEQGNPVAIDKFWELLEKVTFEWILVLDNADIVTLLSKDDIDSRVSDGTGWIRRPRKGNLIVTSRVTDPVVWGAQCIVNNIDIPSAGEAAGILLDLAPGGGTSQEARELSERLGRLPLALHIAGEAIASRYSIQKTFSSYLEHLNALGLKILTGMPEAGARPQARKAIMTTWEISLDYLSVSLPASRFLLRVLSCFASAIPIPMNLLNHRIIASRLPESVLQLVRTDTDIVGNSLYGLAQVGLINPVAEAENDSSIVIHSLVAEASRAHTASNRDSDWTEHEVYSLAAALIADSSQNLPGDEPGTWDEWRVIIPHVRSLLRVAGRDLDARVSDELLHVVFGAMQFFWWSGDVKSSSQLGGLALNQLSEHSADLATLLSVRGSVALAEGHFEGWTCTEQLLRQLTEKGADAGISNSPELLRISQELANCLRENGKLAEAESRFREVCQMRSIVLGPDHRDTLDSMHELGRTISRSGHFGESLRIFTALVDARVRTLGEDNPRTLAAQHEFASCLANEGRLGEAIARMTETFQRRNSLVGPKHSATLESRQELAKFYGAEGDLGRAISELSMVADLWKETLGTESPRTISCMHDLALALLQAGQLREACEQMDAVFDLRLRVLGGDHPDTRESQDALEDIRFRIQQGSLFVTQGTERL
jgi:hypothetical protein